MKQAFSLRKGRVCAILSLALAGCSHPAAIVRTAPPLPVYIPVTTACSAPRPSPVVPLNRQFTEAEWSALDVRQKAALVGKQALDRLTYGEQLDASTSACK